MNLFHEIKSDISIDQLLKFTNNFHDSLIKEIKIFNCEFIAKNGVGHSHPYGFHFDALFLFQQLRVQDNPIAIEILFEKIVGFHLVPAIENHSSQVYSVHFKLKNNLIYCAVDVSEEYIDKDWLPGESDSYDITWIISKVAKWRFVKDGLGSRVKAPFQGLDYR